MTVRRKTWLCRYQYDPLDRVVNCAPLKLDSVQRFYRKNRLVTEIQGPVRYSVFEHESQLMAQQEREASQVTCTLLATDLQRSVSHVVADGQHESLDYPPYGHQSPESGLSSLLGFNGERRDPVTGHYLLGNGYRAFNPVLMRFNSPDSLSPFGKGGVNAYAYCAGDPINRGDPTGHWQASIASFLKRTSDFPGTANVPVKPSVKNSSALVSETQNLYSRQLDALDLAIPEKLYSIDKSWMDDAIKARVQAQKTLDAAREQYSVVRRFAASPPLNEIPNFNPADIVNSTAYQQFGRAQRGVTEAQANFEQVRSDFLARYPRDNQDVVAKIRSAERRGSI